MAHKYTHGAIVEYRDIQPGEMSRTEVIRTGRMNDYKRSELTLAHHTEGFRTAGSTARYSVEHWSVTFDLDGARNGRTFLELKDAEELFGKWTAEKD